MNKANVRPINMMMGVTRKLKAISLKVVREQIEAGSACDTVQESASCGCFVSE